MRLPSQIQVHLEETPHAVFVDTNNTVYANSWYNDLVAVWRNGSSTPTRTINSGLYSPWGLFVAKNGDIYIDNGDSNGRVDKWTSNATSGVKVMNISKPCSGLFIDTSDTLYCSSSDLHKVMKTSLRNSSSLPVRAAGNGSAGSTSVLLNGPWGMFVDTDLTLYVADSNNNRIQRFNFGNSSGVTVAGSAAAGTIVLLTPTGVVLDADGYLFIMDTDNFRIVASSSTGFRCIAGCSGGGSASNQLNHARAISFDSYGNLFVSDDDNSRIQKFLLISNSCGQFISICRVKFYFFLFFTGTTTTASVSQTTS